MNYISRFGDSQYANCVYKDGHQKYSVIPFWLVEQQKYVYYNIPMDITIEQFLRIVQSWLRKDTQTNDPIYIAKLVSVVDQEEKEYTFIDKEEDQYTMMVSEYLKDHPSTLFVFCNNENPKCYNFITHLTYF